jgi:hypothetical protein
MASYAHADIPRSRWFEVSARDLFSDNYFDARQRFLISTSQAGLAVETFEHPEVTDARGTIATDVARLGPNGAKNVLFVLSGVHGTELTAGSGLQLGLMAEYANHLFVDTAIIFVHAVNAVGSSRCRRTDEGNVDPNRNVRDFAKPLPVNEAYASLYQAICPEDWNGAGREVAEAEISSWVEKNGQDGLTKNVLRGQYDFPDGLFYGGTKRVWCVENLSGIIKYHTNNASRVAVLDLHTGLGPKGYGEPMRMHEIARDGADWELIGGLVVDLIDEVVTAPNGLKVLLEFGTVDFDTILEAQRADNWLMRQGDPDTDEGRRIKANIKAALFVDEAAWCRGLYDQTQKITAGLLAELIG